VAYVLVIKRMQCATSKHPMRHLWRMRHKLVILAVYSGILLKFLR